MPETKAKQPLFQNGLVLGFLAAFLWGTHSVIVRYLTSDLGGLQIALTRLFIAALAHLLHTAGHAGVRVDPTKAIGTFRLAVLSTVVNYILFHIGLGTYTGAANAMVLGKYRTVFCFGVPLFLCGHACHADGCSGDHALAIFGRLS